MTKCTAIDRNKWDRVQVDKCETLTRGVGTASINEVNPLFLCTLAILNPLLLRVSADTLPTFSNAPDMFTICVEAIYPNLSLSLSNRVCGP